MRHQVLIDKPLCAMCVREGIVRAAQEVDHIKALINGGDDTFDNLQGLCKLCHVDKTKADIAESKRVEYGQDGYPRGVQKYIGHQG